MTSADQNNPPRLTGKVAIVTGAGQGLGEAQARLLAARGATVVITDHNTNSGNSVARALSDEFGNDVLFVQHDVALEADWHRVIDEVSSRFRQVDILVNNAGIVEFSPIEQTTHAQFQRLMNINVGSVFLGCKLVLPSMQAAGGGSIVNISSISGIVAGKAGSSAYSASKGAVRLLTKAVAMDYAQYGIRVNSVHPGGVATPLTQPYLDNPETRWMVVGRAPMERPGQPDEIARVVAFLASSEASFMTGSEVVVDGGYLAS